MKRFSTLYYLLFMLLILGAFASMAQNNYGIKLLGVVAIAFALLFALEFIDEAGRGAQRDSFALVELGCLVILAGIFASGIFFVRFPYMDLLFMLSLSILFLLYLRKAVRAYTQLYSRSRPLSVGLMLFYGSICIFLLAHGVRSYFGKVSTGLGVAGLGMVLLLALTGFFTRKRILDGQNMTGLSYTFKARENAILLISILSLFTLYSTLTQSGALPGMYSDEYPQAYYKLVNEANTGKENTTHEKYRYSDFKEKYSEFVKKNLATSK